MDSSVGLFDGFWAAAVFIHIPKNEITDSLKKISIILKNEAIGFITMKEGVGEEIEKGTGRLFSYYTEEEFRKVLDKTGFTVLKFERRESAKNSWLVFYVKNA